MKMAVQYWLNRGERARTKVLAFRGGYHGDTLATMAVCDPDEGMHALFAGVLPQQLIAPLPVNEASRAALETLLAREAGRVAAILVEPLVQGAGGMLFHDPAVLATLREMATRHGAFLIFDEIFTGFGRTGSLFACRRRGRRARHPDAVQGADRRNNGAGGDDRHASACSTASGRTRRRTR